MKLSMRGIAIASGLVWGGAVLFVGIANLIRPPYGEAFLDLASSIYPGYEAGEGAGSVLVGTVYGLLDGFIGGLLFAWLYNLFACCKNEKKEAGHGG